MSISEWNCSSATDSDYRLYCYPPKKGCDLSSVDVDSESIKKELKTIAKEQDEDKEKYLPKFNPEDIDI